MKKFLVFTLSKIYWLILLAIPLIPEYVLREFHSASVCSSNGICFRYGNSSLNGEAMGIVNFSIALLLPLCLWGLAGRHIFSLLLRPPFSWKNAIDIPIKIMGWAYWLLIAFIPMLFWYVFGTFQAPSECGDTGSCIKYYVPPDGIGKIAVFVVCGLLWPMCIFRLKSGMGLIAERIDLFRKRR